LLIAYVGLLCRRGQIADRHVLDHPAAQRAHLGHLKSSCLRVGCHTPSSQAGGTSHHPAAPSPASRSRRRSGFVQSPHESASRAFGITCAAPRCGHLAPYSLTLPRPSSGPRGIAELHSCARREAGVGGIRFGLGSNARRGPDRTAAVKERLRAPPCGCVLTAVARTRGLMTLRNSRPKAMRGPGES
jgi:hypothetical protein